MHYESLNGVAPTGVATEESEHLCHPGRRSDVRIKKAPEIRGGFRSFVCGYIVCRLFCGSYVKHLDIEDKGRAGRYAAGAVDAVSKRCGDVEDIF